MSSLTPRLHKLLEKANQIAKKDFESAKKTKKNVPKLVLNFRNNNINGTENNQPIKIPKDINLTARMEKLLEKVDILAKQAAKEKEIREIDDLVTIGEKEVDQIEEHELLEKVDILAKQAAKEKEIREIDDLVTIGEKEVDQIEEHEDWYGVDDSVRYGPHDWDKRMDHEYHGTPDHGVEYYFDKISGVSIWNKPIDYVEQHVENEEAYERFDETVTVNVNE